MLWLIALSLCEAVFGNTSLEMEVENLIEHLQDQIYEPIKLYTDLLNDQFQNFLQRLTNHKSETNDLINLLIDDMEDELLTVSQNFRDLRLDPESCEKQLNQNVEQNFKASTTDIEELLLEKISKAHRIVIEARSIFLVAQNQTRALGMKVNNCLSSLDNTNCLIQAINEIFIMEKTYPKILQVAQEQHQRQLTFLEDETAAELDIQVVKFFDKLVEHLGEFLICVMESS